MDITDTAIVYAGVAAAGAVLGSALLYHKSVRFYLRLTLAWVIFATIPLIPLAGRLVYLTEFFGVGLGAGIAVSVATIFAIVVVSTAGHDICP